MIIKQLYDNLSYGQRLFIDIYLLRMLWAYYFNILTQDRFNTKYALMDNNAFLARKRRSYQNL